MAGHQRQHDACAKGVSSGFALCPPSCSAAQTTNSTNLCDCPYASAQDLLKCFIENTMDCLCAVQKVRAMQVVPL